MRRLGPVFVWAVWLGMTLSAALFVARLGGRVPVQDDFFYLGLRLDPSVPSAASLWEQLNEHRLPLPQLVTWAVGRTLGLGLRSQMAVDLVLLAGLAAALVAAARRLRGSTRPADAFFPLVMLTVGQYENLLWAVQVNFILPVALQLTALILVAGAGERVSARRAAGVGLCAAALPLCGMQGVLAGAVLAGWLLIAARGGAPCRRCWDWPRRGWWPPTSSGTSHR